MATGTCKRAAANGGRTQAKPCAGWYCGRSDEQAWRQAAQQVQARIDLLVRMWLGDPPDEKSYIDAWRSDPPPVEVDLADAKIREALDLTEGVFGGLRFVWQRAAGVEALVSAVQEGNCALDKLEQAMRDRGLDVPDAPPTPEGEGASPWRWYAIGAAGVFVVIAAALGARAVYARKGESASQAG